MLRAGLQQLWQRKWQLHAVRTGCVLHQPPGLLDRRPLRSLGLCQSVHRTNRLRGRELLLSQRRRRGHAELLRDRLWRSVLLAGRLLYPRAERQYRLRHGLRRQQPVRRRRALLCAARQRAVHQSEQLPQRVPTHRHLGYPALPLQRGCGVQQRLLCPGHRQQRESCRAVCLRAQQRAKLRLLQPRHELRQQRRLLRRQPRPGQRLQHHLHQRQRVRRRSLPHGG